MVVPTDSESSPECRGLLRTNGVKPWTVLMHDVLSELFAPAKHAVPMCHARVKSGGIGATKVLIDAADRGKSLCFRIFSAVFNNWTEVLFCRLQSRTLLLSLR